MARGYRQSNTHGTHAPSGERSGAGPVAGSREMGGMGPGKIAGTKFAAKNYFEGGANNYKPKGMRTQDPRQESDGGGD